MLLIAAAAIVFGATRLSDASACEHAKDRGFAAALGRPVAGGPDKLARDVSDHCRGGSALSATSAVLSNRGALVAAERLAREAIARDPRDYQGWVALAIVAQREHHPAQQRAAARRALALNPRYGAALQLLGPAHGGGAPAGP
jgi:hypothetical protein